MAGPPGSAPLGIACSHCWGFSTLVSPSDTGACPVLSILGICIRWRSTHNSLSRTFILHYTNALVESGCPEKRKVRLTDTLHDRVKSMIRHSPPIRSKNECRLGVRLPNHTRCDTHRRLLVHIRDVKMQGRCPLFLIFLPPPLSVTTRMWA